MNATATILVVSGALLHAYWNVHAKKASGGVPFIFLFGLVSVAMMAPAVALRLHETTVTLDGSTIVAIVASAVIHVLYSYALQMGYRSGDFSVVYPIARGVAPLLTVAGAALVLFERTPLANWLGAASIAIGIVLLGVGDRLFARNRQPALSSSGRGIGWACVTGASISAYTLVDGWAIAKLHADPVVYYGMGLALRSMLFAVPALRNREGLRATARNSMPQIAVVGICAPLAYLLILLALQHAPVSQVAPLREMSMLFGVFAGGVHLGERIGGAKAFGVAALGLGALLVFLA